eukprot:5199096-Pleurochrysis_carterae.AAC.1
MRGGQGGGRARGSERASEGGRDGSRARQGGGRRAKDRRSGKRGTCAHGKDEQTRERVHTGRETERHVDGRRGRAEGAISKPREEGDEA